jgi:hypothetical protein
VFDSAVQPARRPTEEPVQKPESELDGPHLLLTYRCTFECDHCFVWSSPRQSGTMTLEQIEQILRQVREFGTVEWIYYEGGEPFLDYAVLVKGLEMASERGFRTGIVSNAYGATSKRDALEWLRPLAGMIQDLSIGDDRHHRSDETDRPIQNAIAAACALGIPIGTIGVAQPEATNAAISGGRLPRGESAVMYRGRAAERLASRAALRPWEQFTECPHENLRDPGRVHVDPFGNVHVCQGISLGNLSRTPLREIWEACDPDAHPITGPLVTGGPVEPVNRYELPHPESYADACHLCYRAPPSLRAAFPNALAPDQVYEDP